MKSKKSKKNKKGGSGINPLFTGFDNLIKVFQFILLVLFALIIISSIIIILIKGPRKFIQIWIRFASNFTTFIIQLFDPSLTYETPPNTPTNTPPNTPQSDLRRRTPTRHEEFEEYEDLL